MQVMSLNIWGGKMKEPLLDFFKNNSDKVDIFCLQEVFDNGKTTRPIYQMENMNIFSEIQKVLPNHIGYFAPSEGNEEGLAIFWRSDIKIIDKGDVFCFRWKDAMQNDDSRTLGRNLQYVSFSQNDKEYLIGNFHGLWNGEGKLDSNDRLEQSRKMATFLDNRNEEYKIIMGDFNLLPTTESIKILENGMKNLIKEYNIQSTRTSLYTKNEKFADYVFTTPNVNIKNFTVLPEEVSDHSTLLIEI